MDFGDSWSVTTHNPQPHLKDSSAYRQLRPTNVYGRYHYLRDVARQAFDASRSLDPRSLMRMAQRYGRSIMLALAWATAAPSSRCWDSMTLGAAMPTGSSILSGWAYFDDRQNHL